MSATGKILRFRDSFGKTDAKQFLASWFPGHMHKGMVQMQRQLKTVDCIIEVHDARVPFSGRNPKFCNMLYAIKPHILVLNKIDLADMSQKTAIQKKLLSQGVHNVLFTNCTSGTGSGVGNVITKAIELIQNSEKYNRVEATDYRMMIIGIPNVGKSSLINRLRNQILRKGKATHVGASPGITRSVLEKIKICDDPLTYLLDTPGVMQPHVHDIEVGLRLALCCTLQDHIVGEDKIADYLLFWLNKHQNFKYVDFLGIPEPTDNVYALLYQVAINMNKTRLFKSPTGEHVTVPNLQFAAMHFIRAFRNGEFGKVLLDDDHINK